MARIAKDILINHQDQIRQEKTNLELDARGTFGNIHRGNYVT